MDEIVAAKKERNQFKKERDQLEKKLKRWEEGETANTDVWVELMANVNSQSKINQIKEDYEKRKKDIDENGSSRSRVKSN